MTTKATAKPKPEDTEPSSQDILAGFMTQHKDEHFNEIVPLHKVVSMGSLKLDSRVKIRSGCVVRFSGLGAELGKTSETLVLIDNYLKTMPKSKAIFFKAEGRLSEDIKIRSGLKFVYKAEDWVYGTVFVFSGNIFESVAQLLETLLTSMHAKGEHLAAAIDSLDGLRLRADADKDLWGGKDSPKVAGVQLLTKMLFRSVALPVTHYDALLIITSQYSTPISLDMYAPAAPRQISGGGGSAMMHQADYTFELGQRYNGDYILENPDEKPDSIKNKIVGIWATYIIKKSGTDVSGEKIRVPIKKGRVGCAIWVEKEIGEMLQAYELLKKDPEKPKSSWLYFDKALRAEAKAEGIELVEKVNALSGLFDYIETDRKVFEWLYAKFRKMLTQDEA